jgi:hypothetical protein
MLDGTVWEMYGDQARQVFEGMQQRDNRYLVVKKGKNQTFIPIQNILFVEFAMATLRDQIEEQIEEKWEQIFALVHHPYYDAAALEEMEWFSEENTTYIREEGGQWQVITYDPRVAKLMFEIEALNHKLELLENEES